MSYQALAESMQAQGFSRVERDDRLLDVFPAETRVKGVELYEKWQANEVHLIRIHNKKQQRFSLPRKQIEQALLQNQRLTLSPDLLTDHAA